MPMVWNAEADAKLMAKIIQMCDIKLSGAQMKELAETMGSGCTTKAISHRLTHFRKLTTAKNTSTATKSAKPAAGKVSKVTKPKDLKAKKAKAETAARATTPFASEMDEDGALPTPPTTVSRGIKRKYGGVKVGDDEGRQKKEHEDGEDEKEREVEGLNDDVKIEVGEDIGEGLRSSVEDEDEF